LGFFVEVDGDGEAVPEGWVADGRHLLVLCEVVGCGLSGWDVVGGREDCDGGGGFGSGKCGCCLVAMIANWSEGS